MPTQSEIQHQTENLEYLNFKTVFYNKFMRATTTNFKTARAFLIPDILNADLYYGCLLFGNSDDCIAEAIELYKTQ